MIGSPIAVIVKGLKHADSNVSSSRDMESKGCIHRATAGARGRAAPVRNGCYRLSALLWKQASGGGAALWRCSEVLSWVLACWSWLPPSDFQLLESGLCGGCFCTFLESRWADLPGVWVGFGKSCHVETPRFCWEMFYYGYVTCVLPIKCQLVLNDLQAKKPKGFLRWPPAIGRSAFQISSWGRLSTPQEAPVSEVTLWMWIPSHFKSLLCIMHLFQLFFF